MLSSRWSVPGLQSELAERPACSQQDHAAPESVDQNRLQNNKNWRQTEYLSPLDFFLLQYGGRRISIYQTKSNSHVSVSFRSSPSTFSLLAFSVFTLRSERSQSTSRWTLRLAVRVLAHLRFFHHAKNNKS